MSGYISKMGTQKTFEKKLSSMIQLLKRKDLGSKAEILREFCLTQVCSMSSAREIYNIVKSSPRDERLKI